MDSANEAAIPAMPLSVSAANDSTPALSSKAITFMELRRADRTTRGKVYPGEVLKRQHATLVPGESITLFGARGERYDGEKMVDLGNYNLEFRVGSRAIVSGGNFIGVGKISQIGPKTITVSSNAFSQTMRVHRFSIVDFAAMNWNFDEERIRKHNDSCD